MFTLDDEWWECEITMGAKRGSGTPYFTMTMSFSIHCIEEEGDEALTFALNHALDLLLNTLGNFDVKEFKVVDPSKE
jgi:hypothetical protein